MDDIDTPDLSTASWLLCPSLFSSRRATHVVRMTRTFTSRCEQIGLQPRSVPSISFITLPVSHMNVLLYYAPKQEQLQAPLSSRHFRTAQGSPSDTAKRGRSRIYEGKRGARIPAGCCPNQVLQACIPLQGRLNTTNAKSCVQRQTSWFFMITVSRTYRTGLRIESLMIPSTKLAHNR